jgi:c-di-GMP-binding flagellar brake protein YcgR
MSEEDFLDRRKYRRVNVNIPVKYRVISSDDISSVERLSRNSKCVNISRGGMQIVTEEEWEANDEKLIEAEFIMSGRKIRLIAHVVWAGYDSAVKKYRAGMEFIVIKSGDLEVIGQIA